MKFSLLINNNMTTIVYILTWLAGRIQHKKFLKQESLFFGSEGFIGNWSSFVAL